MRVSLLLVLLSGCAAPAANLRPFAAKDDGFTVDLPEHPLVSSDLDEYGEGVVAYASRHEQERILIKVRYSPVTLNLSPVGMLAESKNDVLTSTLGRIVEEGDAPNQGGHPGWTLLLQGLQQSVLIRALAIPHRLYEIRVVTPGSDGPSDTARRVVDSFEIVAR